MYCKSCGSENDDVARFCKDCGRAITGSSPSVERVASADRGDTPDAVGAPTKANTWIWVAGGVGLVVVLLFAGLILLALEAASGIADSSLGTDREVSAVPFGAQDDTGPPTPENARYVWDNSTIVVTWDASEGAEYYTIYYDDFFDDNCKLDSDGVPAFCDELATNIVGTSYVHTTPDGRENHYWAVACNRDGCSYIDSDSPAEYMDTRPASPTNVRVEFEPDGTRIQVSWDPVPDAEHYKIYYDDFFGDNCRVDRFGDASFCDELASDLRQTSYLHAHPGRDENYYWVVACNSGGCSNVNSDSPAEIVDTRPAGPSNVRAQLVQGGTQIQVSWDPVPDAEHYRIYYDDFVGDNCQVDRFGDASFCDELASDIQQTSYVHTDPDRDENYYWVVACNSGGCSNVDRENPAVVE